MTFLDGQCVWVRMNEVRSLIVNSEVCGTGFGADGRRFGSPGKRVTAG